MNLYGPVVRLWGGGATRLYMLVWACSKVVEVGTRLYKLVLSCSMRL